MVAEPIIPVKWAFRSRVADQGGGSWGVHGGDMIEFFPLDWRVTRRKNEPAVAQVVLEPSLLNNDQSEALRGMFGQGSMSSRTFGISCFRDDFKEEDGQDAIFFGPVTAIDMSYGDAITIHAQDMFSLAKGILVGTHKFVDKPIHEIFGAIQGEWTKGVPKATGLDFKGENPRMSFECDVDEMKTLYDVVKEICEVNNLNVHQPRSIDLMFTKAGQVNYTLGPDIRVGRDSITRLFGPESQPNVIRVCGGDRTEEGRQVATYNATSEPYEFSLGRSLRAPEGIVGDGLKKFAEARAREFKNPAISATVEVIWKEGEPLPRPGQVTTTELNIGIRFEEDISDTLIRAFGVIGSVEISQDLVSLEFTRE